MSNSELVDIVVPADKGNYTIGRQGCNIEAITIHHMAAVASAEACGQIFASKGRGGSSHYGIGNNGEIAQYVDEENTAWTNSNWESNCKSVTIETSNSEKGGEWRVSDAALSSLIRLVADIAKRNNLGTLVKGENLTWHQMFAATACPGDYLLSKLDYIIEEANKLNEVNEMVDFNSYPGVDNQPSDWSEEAITWAIENGIMYGDEEGLRLRDHCTREQMCVFLHRLYKLVTGE